MKHTPTEPAPRYALYFAPEEGSAWQLFGAEWFARIPEAPRRYGFHATLKAPFRLARGTALADLLAELARYCAALQPFVLPPLEAVLLDDFVALVPVRPERRIDELAAECVMRFDRFRAPLNETDLARRRPERLEPGELDMLRHWGYPYVLDLFRFHLSLTGPLGADRGERGAALSAEAGQLIAALAPADFASICVYVEPQPGAPFDLIERIALGAQTAAASALERAG